MGVYIYLRFLLLLISLYLDSDLSIIIRVRFNDCMSDIQLVFVETEQAIDQSVSICPATTQSLNLASRGNPLSFVIAVARLLLRDYVTVELPDCRLIG